MCQGIKRLGAAQPWNGSWKSSYRKRFQLGTVQKQAHHVFSICHRTFIWWCNVFSLIRLHYRLPSKSQSVNQTWDMSYFVESHCSWRLDVPTGFDTTRTSKTTDNVFECWRLAVEWKFGCDEENLPSQWWELGADFEWCSSPMFLRFPIYLPNVVG